MDMRLIWIYLRSTMTFNKFSLYLLSEKLESLLNRFFTSCLKRIVGVKLLVAFKLLIYCTDMVPSEYLLILLFL